MFTKRTEVTVTVGLTDEARTSLGMLDRDVQALVALVQDLVATHDHVRKMLQGEIEAQIRRDVADAAPDAEPESYLDGIRVFAPPPAAMAAQTEFDTSLSDDDRVRAAPYTRAPRNVQIEWLRNVMADGRWYAVATIAEKYGTDAAHKRYLQGAVNGRLREMYLEGEAERRDSRVKGSVHEYRLRQGQTA